MFALAAADHHSVSWLLQSKQLCHAPTQHDAAFCCRRTYLMLKPYLFDAEQLLAMQL
jgi:hypothetical protein